MRTGWLAASAALGLAFGLPGCAADRDCAGNSSVDQGVAAGQPTSRAALDALLSSHPKWVDQEGWSVGATVTKPDPTVTYVAAGGDRVEVSRSSLNGRWYLSSYQGCR